jgi:hypothetical protein
MKTTLITIILTSFMMFVGCGVSKKMTSVDSSVTSTEQTTVSSTATGAVEQTENRTETAATELGLERTTFTTETTTTTEYSMPDSLGNQHKVRETTTVKSTDESEQQGANTIHRINTEKVGTRSVTTMKNTDTNREETTHTSTVEQSKRKRGIGGYLWAFGVGSVVVAAIVYRRKILALVLRFM